MDGPLRPGKPTARPLMIAIVATVVILYLLPVAGHPPATNPNELVRLELALSMAVWTTVDLGQPARIYGLSEDVAHLDGRVLADKAPGLSFAAVPVVWLAGLVAPTVPGTGLPAYWPLRHLATGLVVAVSTGLLSFFLTASVRDLRSAGWVPLAVVAALATPLWTYGTVFFGHAPAAALISAAWILLLRPFTDADPANARSAFVGGLAAGLAVVTEYPTLLLVLVVFGTMIARKTPRRRLARAGLGLGLGLLPAAFYHHAAFGAPWLTGYAFKADPDFAAIHTTGLAGITLPTIESLSGVLLGSSRGLFFYSPILLLAPFGLWLIHRRHGLRESAPLTVAVIAYTFFAAGFVDWPAGWCAAARHLLPLVPLLVIPMLVAVAALSSHRWALLGVAVLASLSATRNLLTLVISPFFPPVFDNPLGQFVMPSIVDGVGAPNLLSTFTGIPPLIGWGLVAGLVAVLLTWALLRTGRGSAVVVAMVIGLSMVGQLGWLAWRSSPADVGLEMIRAQILAGQGHTEAANRIVAELGKGQDPGSR